MHKTDALLDTELSQAMVRRLTESTLGVLT
jgi:glutathione synthase